MEKRSDEMEETDALSKWIEQTNAAADSALKEFAVLKRKRKEAAKPAGEVIEEKPPEPKRRDNDGLHRRHGKNWEFSLTINGKRKSFSTGTANFQEARRIRGEAIKQQLEHRLPTDRSKWLFEKLLAKVLEDRKLHLAEGTRRLERERSVPLLKYFNGRRVSEIDSDAIKAYQTARMKQVGPRTINLEVKLLRQVMKAAKTWGTVSDDYKRLPEDRRGPGRALTDDQLKLLFSVAKSRPGCDAAFYAGVVAANTTGRSIELKTLRLADVDLINGIVRIGRSKTDAGKRPVPLNAGAMWGFARLLERANALGAISPDHFLFPRSNFRSKSNRGIGYDPTLHQKGWRTAWRSLIRATAKIAGDDAAVFHGLRFHDLRHCAITSLAESGASDQTIMAIAGHLDRQMMEHYSHIRMAAKRKAVEAIQSFVPEDMEPAPVTKKVQ
jgi:integrase